MFDLALVENTEPADAEVPARQRPGQLPLRHRASTSAATTRCRGCGATSTAKRSNTGPVSSSLTSYPEYIDLAWTRPKATSHADQRHRVRMWGTCALPITERLGNLHRRRCSSRSTPARRTARSAACDRATSSPTRATVEPPDTVNYWFTDRDAFRTETMYRTDFSLNYGYRLGGQTRALRADPGAEPVQSVPAVQHRQQRHQYDRADRRRRSGSVPDVQSVHARRPVQGVHWDYGEEFGKPSGAAAYTLPRTFQFALGVRF